MEKTYSRDGTPLAFTRSGTGPALVLVSGALSTGATLAPLAAALSDRFEVVVYDRRGRGASGDTPPYAVDREVEDLAALAETLGGQSSFYGVSSGGALVLRAAASGLPVRRVAVYEVPYALDEAAVATRLAYTERLTEALGAGRPGDAVELFLRLTGLGEDVIDRARHSPMWAGLESVAPSLAYDDAVLGDGRPPRETLAAIGVPVLALAGGAGAEPMRAAARTIAETVPDGRYAQLAGQSHMVEPGVLAPVLAEFFGE